MSEQHEHDHDHAAHGRGPGEFLGVVPVFLVDDVAATAQYYRDVLGFDVEFLFPDDEPTYSRVIRGDAIIDFTLSDPEGARNSVKASGSQRGTDIVIVVSDVEDVYTDMQEHGASVLERLDARETGMLDFTIEDPNGYRLTIGGDLDEAGDDEDV
ncbi:MAG TPA: VOC family protein [Dehalococcoidia bacterium]|nr:VOC family protein [Dehalococcoidia bacterium]